MQVYVESLWEGVDFSTTLSRARFDGVAAGTMAAFVQLAREAAQRCALTEAQISKVMLLTTRPALIMCVFSKGSSRFLPEIFTIRIHLYPNFCMDQGTDLVNL